MTFVLLITLLESLALSLWMIQRWHSRNTRAKRAAILLQIPSTPQIDNRDLLLPTNAGDAAHWAFINEWHLAPQADDRIVMDGTVAISAGTPSARRAFARRSHQVNFKAWSQARRD